MPNAISSINSNQATDVAPVVRPRTPSANGSAANARPATDTIQLSSSAIAVLAAAKEFRETPAQTANEASHGDLQARRLLAKEAATKIS